jgi:hypothetical protein
MKRSSVVVEMINDEADEAMLIFERMECRNIQISCIATKSLAGAPEACRPKEGLKSIAPKHPEALGMTIRRAPTERPSFPT